MSEKLEWHAVTLEEIAEITGGGTPKREVHAYWNGNIPWATPTDITNNKKVIEKTAEYITEEGLKNSSAKLLPAGTVLMTSRATIGYCAINTVPMATNQGFANFICKNNVYNLFLLYLLTFHKDNFEKLGSGSTFKEVAKSTLKSYRVEIPPLPEQRKIAAILSTVDEAIEKTEAIIEQTEKVKKGLMQQLLTKGIGHTKFKKTEIGEIPEEWEVKRLSEISLINMGQSPSSAVCNDLGEGIPFFQGNAEFGMKHPIPKRWCTEPTKLANKGDILISVRAPVGELNIANQTCCIGRGLAAITPTKINNDYLYFAMQIYKSSLLKVSQGSTFTAINKQDLHNLLLPVPSLIEQKKISAILLSLDSKFEKEKKKLNQLQFMKTGLMQVLLTGKVRVKVDEDEVTSS
ncbi:restriction endonuclease subunit S [Thermoactinomyces sp. CICC 23799]|uniref:restriction endonuclease subunit S n=1 Tax=Thermoactinomyces sp. CICC 23799 TaxID=2767429 RepID=UPI0018DC0EE5|nr:restriction endonuclease subunit S [Thermoactinomyces sp. CICC 23799]MBH8601168.1 restriction endonuclease subunit S [Thermoactinomyces sp. CICC 23799]